MAEKWELFEEANNYNCYDLYLIIDDAMSHGFEVKVFDNKVFFREVTPDTPKEVTA